MSSELCKASKQSPHPLDWTSPGLQRRELCMRDLPRLLVKLQCTHLSASWRAPIRFRYKDPHSLAASTTSIRLRRWPSRRGGSAFWAFCHWAPYDWDWTGYLLLYWPLVEPSTQCTFRSDGDVQETAGATPCHGQHPAGTGRHRRRKTVECRLIRSVFQNWGRWARSGWR